MRNIYNNMAIIKTEKLEIEIQKQVMNGAACNYFILIKSENGKKNSLKIMTSGHKPIIKYTEDNGNIVVKKNN